MAVDTQAAFGRIPLDQIDAADVTADVSELRQSIEQNGLINPIVVRSKTDGRFEVVAGHHRLAAVKGIEGATTIEAQVRDADPATHVVLATVENMHRRTLGPIEEARQYDVLRREHGLSQEDIARRVGRSHPHVSKRLSLLRLPDHVQGQVGDELSIGAAEELVKLHTAPEVLAVAHTAILRGTPVDAAVNGGLARIDRENRIASAVDRLRTEHGREPWEGVLGKNGWRVVSEDPQPDELYWPSTRPDAEDFRWGIADDATFFQVTTEPLAHMNDSDPQVAESAAKLVSLFSQGTVDQPAKAVSSTEAAEIRQKAERAHWKQMKRVDEGREAHLTKRVRGAAAKPADVLDFVSQAFLDVLPKSVYDTVMARANVARVERTNGFGEMWDLPSYLAGRGTWVKLAYGAALQVRENEVDEAIRQKIRLAHGDQADRFLRYFQELERTGYSLSQEEAELANMEADASPPDDDPVDQ